MTARRADMEVARQKDPRGELSAERARLLFSYNPETGILTNRVRRGAHAQVGAVAGHLDAHGYLAVSVDRWPYLVHRLIWLIVHGEMPAFVDHRDKDRLNNRLVNLRAVTQSQNNKNTSIHRDSTTGLKGVSQQKTTGRFYARIVSDGVCHRLGTFDTAEAASAAYTDASRRLHGDFSSVPMALQDIPAA